MLKYPYSVFLLRTRILAYMFASFNINKLCFLLLVTVCILSVVKGKCVLAFQ